MKAYPLLYLSLFSFVTILACKPPRTTQAKKMKEMEKKELKILSLHVVASRKESSLLVLILKLWMRWGIRFPLVNT